MTNTPLFLLRAKQIGFNINELELIDMGTVLDMITESSNDNHEYRELASQEDFARF